MANDNTLLEPPPAPGVESGAFQGATIPLPAVNAPRGAVQGGQGAVQPPPPAPGPTTFQAFQQSGILQPAQQPAPAYTAPPDWPQPQPPAQQQAAAPAQTPTPTDDQEPTKLEPGAGSRLGERIAQQSQIDPNAPPEEQYRQNAQQGLITPPDANDRDVTQTGAGDPDVVDPNRQEKLNNLSTDQIIQGSDNGSIKPEEATTAFAAALDRERNAPVNPGQIAHDVTSTAFDVARGVGYGVSPHNVKKGLANMFDTTGQMMNTFVDALGASDKNASAFDAELAAHEKQLLDTGVIDQVEYAKRMALLSQASDISKRLEANPFNTDSSGVPMSMPMGISGVPMPDPDAYRSLQLQKANLINQIDPDFASNRAQQAMREFISGGHLWGDNLKMWAQNMFGDQASQKLENWMHTRLGLPQGNNFDTPDKISSFLAQHKALYEDQQNAKIGIVNPQAEANIKTFSGALGQKYQTGQDLSGENMTAQPQKIEQTAQGLQNIFQTAQALVPLPGLEELGLPSLGLASKTARWTSKLAGGVLGAERPFAAWEIGGSIMDAFKRVGQGYLGGGIHGASAALPGAAWEAGSRIGTMALPWLIRNGSEFAANRFENAFKNNYNGEAFWKQMIDRTLRGTTEAIPSSMLYAGLNSDSPYSYGANLGNMALLHGLTYGVKNLGLSALGSTGDSIVVTDPKQVDRPVPNLTYGEYSPWDKISSAEYDMLNPKQQGRWTRTKQLQRSYVDYYLQPQADLQNTAQMLGATHVPGAPGFTVPADLNPLQTGRSMIFVDPYHFDTVMSHEGGHPAYYSMDPDQQADTVKWAKKVNDPNKFTQGYMQNTPWAGTTYDDLPNFNDVLTGRSPPHPSGFTKEGMDSELAAETLGPLFNGKTMNDIAANASPPLRYKIAFAMAHVLNRLGMPSTTGEARSILGVQPALTVAALHWDFLHNYLNRRITNPQVSTGTIPGTAFPPGAGGGPGGGGGGGGGGRLGGGTTTGGTTGGGTTGGGAKGPTGTPPMPGQTTTPPVMGGVTTPGIKPANVLRVWTPGQPQPATVTPQLPAPGTTGTGAQTPPGEERQTVPLLTGPIREETPVPQALPVQPDESVIQGLMKRGFTRQQAEDFAARGTVTGGAAQQKEEATPTETPTQPGGGAAMPPGEEQQRIPETPTETTTQPPVPTPEGPTTTEVMPQPTVSGQSAHPEVNQKAAAPDSDQFHDTTRAHVRNGLTPGESQKIQTGQPVTPSIRDSRDNRVTATEFGAIDRNAPHKYGDAWKQGYGPFGQVDLSDVKQDGVSVPPEDIIKHFGNVLHQDSNGVWQADPNFAEAVRNHRIMVQVTNPANGRTSNVPLVDIGPMKSTGAGLDVLYKTARDLGFESGKAPMDYHFVAGDNARNVAPGTNIHGLPFASPRNIAAAAEANVGRLNTTEDPGTSGGALACVDAVTRIVHDQLGINLPRSLSTVELNQNMRNGGWIEVDPHTPGAIIVSPSKGSAHGHAGIVGSDGDSIYSNNSRDGTWGKNYSVESWDKEIRAGRGLETHAYVPGPNVGAYTSGGTGAAGHGGFVINPPIGQQQQQEGGVAPGGGGPEQPVTPAGEMTAPQAAYGGGGAAEQEATGYYPNQAAVTGGISYPPYMGGGGAPEAPGVQAPQMPGIQAETPYMPPQQFAGANIGAFMPPVSGAAGGRAYGGIRPEGPEGEPPELSTLGVGNAANRQIGPLLDQGTPASLKEAAKQHASLLSDDDTRVKRQNDGYIKGEHFQQGDDFHRELLNNMPDNERNVLAQAQDKLANRQMMHMTYASAPTAALVEHPTAGTRDIEYEMSSPQARLLKGTRAQLAGHSAIPTSIGVKLAQKAGQPHEGYIQGVSTNVAENNVRHINNALAEMGHNSPYPKVNTKFANDLEGYVSNLNAGYMGTGEGPQPGTEKHPLSVDPHHTPYRLKRREADFLNAVVNNQGARAKTPEGEAIRDLARKGGRLLTEQGETNPFRNAIDAHHAAIRGKLAAEHPENPELQKKARTRWSEDTLEPSIRTFKAGLVHEVHEREADMPEGIRPGREYQQLSESMERQMPRGRPDIPMAAAFMPALSRAEHEELTGNIRKQWVSGKIRTPEYLERMGEVPEPGEPISRAAYMPMAGPKAKGFAQAKAEGRTWKTPLPGGGERFEIDDRDLKFKKAPKGIGTALEHQYQKTWGDPMPLDQAIEHPELFENYPFLRNTKISYRPNIAAHGYYEQPYTNDYGDKTGDHIILKNPKDVATAAHEIQHAIQYHENFLGKGTNSERTLDELMGNPGVKEELHKQYDALHPERAVMSGDSPEFEQSERLRNGWQDNRLRAMAKALYLNEPGEIEARAVGQRALRPTPEDIAEAERELGAKVIPPYEPTPAQDVKAEMMMAGLEGERAGLSMPRFAARPPGGTPTAAFMAPIEKPENWKTQPEKVKQAYLKAKVKQTLANQWTGPDAHPLKVQKNPDGSIQYDPGGKPVYEKHDYNIVNSPLLGKKGLDKIATEDAKEHEDTLNQQSEFNQKGEDQHTYLNGAERRRLSALRNSSAVNTMADRIVQSFHSIKDVPEIMAGKGWYSRMRQRLHDIFGDDHEIFAQLLGATSAKTPVRNNFINALDALEQYKAGKAGQTHEEWLQGLKDGTNHHLGFNKHIAKYQEGYNKMQEGDGALQAYMKRQGIQPLDDDGKPIQDWKSDADALAQWVAHHNILPTSKNISAKTGLGTKYGANSNAVLKVLAGTWLNEVKAPKTPNFAGNLTGRTLEATIDVWAARHLQRLGYEGQTKGKSWRPQAASESGVSAMDFAFSQDAMRKAAEKLNLNPDDLQAVLWFAEKHHYEKQGWTRGQGAAKSSFDDVADLAFPRSGTPMNSAELRSHYQAEAKARQKRQGKIKTAKSYVETGQHQKLADYMQKHSLTHAEVHGQPEPEEEDEEEAA